MVFTIFFQDVAAFTDMTVPCCGIRTGGGKTGLL